MAQRLGRHHGHDQCTSRLYAGGECAGWFGHGVAIPSTRPPDAAAISCTRTKTTSTSKSQSSRPALTDQLGSTASSGGFMLVHQAKDGITRLADCFVAAPGLGLPRRQEAPMQEIDLPFGDSDQSEVFKIGPASCAVPGAVAGLEAAHRRYGRLPWRELLAPAVELARGEVELTEAQAHMHAILDPILRFT